MNKDLDDPEVCFRRGYQHGARDALAAAEKLHKLSGGFGRLRRWIENTLFDWRYSENINQRYVQPPPPPSN